MSVYEIEREDKVVIFHESDTYSELEMFVTDYRMAHPSQSMKVYELNDDMVRVGKPAEFKSGENDVKLINHARTDINQYLHELFDSLPDDVQSGMIIMEHNCDQCDNYDTCTLPYKDEMDLKESDE